MSDIPILPPTPPLEAPASVSQIARPGKGLVHTLVATFSARLQDGLIQPGARLPTESEIMKTFGVSRGVVREAVSRLSAAGLVQTLHGVGTFALEPGRQSRFRLESPCVDALADMLDVLELRASLESDAAGLAAMRRTDAHLVEMREALDDFSRHLSMLGETVTPDFRFHMAIAQAAGNRYYGELMGQLGMAVIPRTRVSASWLDADHRAEHLQKVNHEHQDIHAAIERRDPEAARAAMRIHLVNSRERQRKAYAAAAEERDPQSMP